MRVREVSRRRFLVAGAGSITAALMSDSIARALAIPAHRAHADDAGTSSTS